MRNENKNFNNKRKAVFLTLPIFISGTDVRENEYDTERLMSEIQKLQEQDCFKTFSIPVTIDRDLVIEDGRGRMNIGKINSINFEDNTVDIMISAKHADFADKVKDLTIVPRIIAGKKENDYISVLGFDLDRVS